VMNENYPQPSLPETAHEGVIRGMYCHSRFGVAGMPRVRLLGAGAILREAIAAAALLEQDFGIASEVCSVTSFSELAREAAAVERAHRLAPADVTHPSHLEQCLEGDEPIVAASDYVRAVPLMLAGYLPGRRFIALGTDGFGRSDTRSALRSFFEVDRASIALAAVQALVDTRRLSKDRLRAANVSLGTASQGDPPWQR